VTESGPVTSVFEVTKVESYVQEAYPADAAFTPAEASPWQDKHPIEAPPIVILYAIYPSLHVKALATSKLLKVQVLSPNSLAPSDNKALFPAAYLTVAELHAVQTLSLRPWLALHVTVAGESTSALAVKVPASAVQD